MHEDYTINANIKIDNTLKSSYVDYSPEYGTIYGNGVSIRALNTNSDFQYLSGLDLQITEPPSSGLYITIKEDSNTVSGYTGDILVNANIPTIPNILNFLTLDMSFLDKNSYGKTLLLKFDIERESSLRYYSTGISWDSVTSNADIEEYSLNLRSLMCDYTAYINFTFHE